MQIDNRCVKRNKLLDRIFSWLFLAMAVLSASFIVVIILFVFIKGISPFLPGYEYGQVDLLAFLTGTVYRQDQGVYGVGFIVINTLIASFWHCCFHSRFRF